MISEKLQKAINEQITAEMWSSNLYLAMSFYFEKDIARYRLEDHISAVICSLIAFCNFSEIIIVYFY